MGVVTTADEKISRAKELMNEAYKELLICLNDETWGHNDFSSEYIDAIQEVAVELIRLKRKL